MNKIAKDWQDYECLYAGDGKRIERWGKYILQRPDPLAIWPMPDNKQKIDAIYHRSKRGGGSWEYFADLPKSWLINYQELTFKVAPLGFKHTGLFPEQAVNWQRLRRLISDDPKSDFKVLNLFAYTGAATLACALADVDEIVHVDASKGMVEWAKENLSLSGLNDRKVRFIVDDCLKFITREQRRGRSYQGIIMDPPSYGRGPNKEVWQFNKLINVLIEEAVKLLADDACFFLINTYTTGYSPIVLENLMRSKSILTNTFNKTETGELLLPVSRQNINLPSGIYGIAYNDQNNL